MTEQKKSPGTQLVPTDFDITRDFSETSRWINPPGDAIATRGQLDLWKRSFFDNAQTYERVNDMAEATKAALLHSMGTTLREVRGHSAWKLLGLESWEEYCNNVLKITKRHGNRLVAFAGGITEEQAVFGVRKCLAGLRIVELLGLGALSDLIVKDGEAEPAEWAEQLGEPVHFKESSAVRIEALASGALKPKLPPPTPSARVRRTVARRREIVETVGEKHRAIETLGVKVGARNGKVQHDDASNDAEFAALAALYQALVKG